MARYDQIVHVRDGICAGCGGPVEREYQPQGSAEHVLYKSLRRPSALRSAWAELANYTLEAPGNRHFFTVTEISLLIGEEKATEFLGLLQRFVDTAAGNAENCPLCEGPVEELFTASGESRGLRQTRTDGRLQELANKIYSFRARLNPAFLENPENVALLRVYDYPVDEAEFDPADEEAIAPVDHAPFVSEHFLYGTLGKEDARSVRAYIRGLLEAAGVERASLI